MQVKRRPLFPALHRRRRAGATASRRVAVVSRMPWPVRALTLLLILALGAALGSGLYEYARRVAGLAPPISSSELAQLRADAQRLTTENERLQNRLNESDGRLTIERAARDQLAAELRTAQKEAGDLRNDLAFFEQLIPADPSQNQVNIRSAELERDGQTLRYRVLLMRGGRPSGEFKGTLQFSASGIRAGSSATIDLRPFVPVAQAAAASVPVSPAEAVANAGVGANAGPNAATAVPTAAATVAITATGAGTDPLVLNFRQYQRAEGTLAVPQGFVVRSVTVRVLEGGVVRSQSTVNLPA
jgi:hypothetical protein